MAVAGAVWQRTTRGQAWHEPWWIGTIAIPCPHAKPTCEAVDLGLFRNRTHTVPVFRNRS